MSGGYIGVDEQREHMVPARQVFQQPAFISDIPMFPLNQSAPCSAGSREVVVVVVGGGGGGGFGSDFGSENALEETPQTDPSLGMGGGEERASGVWVFVKSEEQPETWQKCALQRVEIT